MTVELGTATTQPTMTINGSAEKTLERGAFKSYAQTTVLGTGNIVFKTNPTFENLAGSVFDFQSDADVTRPQGDTGGDIINFGTFKKSQQLGDGDINVRFENKGLLQSGAGALSFKTDFKQTAAAAQTELNGGALKTTQAFQLLDGKLSGVGQITGNVWSDAGGEVIPGLGGAPGTLNITGDYAMGPQGKLTINVTAAGIGRLNVQGDVYLDGTLTWNRNGDYKPTLGTALTFLTYASWSGTFTTWGPENDTWSAGGVDNLHFSPEQGVDFQLVVTNFPPGP